MEWLTDGQQRIWRDYLSLTARLHTAMHRQLQQDCELSLSDYDVLVALSERGPVRIRDLGGLLGWEQSRLSHQLRRMRGRGLVEREATTTTDAAPRWPSHRRERPRCRPRRPGTSSWCAAWSSTG